MEEPVGDSSQSGSDPRTAYEYVEQALRNLQTDNFSLKSQMEELRREINLKEEQIEEQKKLIQTLQRDGFRLEGINKREADGREQFTALLGQLQGKFAILTGEMRKYEEGVLAFEAIVKKSVEDCEEFKKKCEEDLTRVYEKVQAIMSHYQEENESLQIRCKAISDFNKELEGKLEESSDLIRQAQNDLVVQQDRSESELTELIEVNRRTKQQADQLVSQVKKLEESDVELAQEITELKRQLLEMEQVLTEKDERIVNLTLEFQNLEQVNANSKRNLAEATDHLQKVQDSMATQEAKNSVIVTELLERASCYEQKEQELVFHCKQQEVLKSQLQDELVSVEMHLAQTKDLLIQRDKENQHLNEKYNSLEMTARDLEDQLTETVDNLKKVKEELNLKEEKVDEKTKEVQDLLEQHRCDVTVLHDRCTELEEEKKRLQKTVNTLQSQCSEATSSAAEASSENEILRDQCEALKVAGTEMQKKLAEVAYNLQQNEEAMSLKDLELEKKQLELTEMISLNEEKQTQLEGSRLHLEKSVNLQEQLDFARNELQDVKNAFDRVTGENDALRANQSTSEITISQHQEKLAEVTNELQIVTEMNAALKQTQMQTEEKWIELQNLVVLYQDKQMHLQNELQEKRDVFAQQQALLIQSNAMETANAKLEVDYFNAKQKLEELEEALKVASAVKLAHSEKLMFQESQLADLKKAITKLKTECSEVKQSKNALEAKVLKLQNDLKEQKISTKTSVQTAAQIPKDGKSKTCSRQIRKKSTRVLSPVHAASEDSFDFSFDDVGISRRISGKTFRSPSPIGDPKAPASQTAPLPQPQTQKTARQIYQPVKRFFKSK